jgi:hypothetical protein
MASGYGEFLRDLRDLTTGSGAGFTTLDHGSRFRARFTDNDNLTVERDEGDEVIPAEAIENAWSALQSGLVTVGPVGALDGSGRDRLLFSLLAELPYVQVTRMERRRNGSYEAGHGLYLREGHLAAEITAERRPLQTRLWR